MGVLLIGDNGYNTRDIGTRNVYRLQGKAFLLHHTRRTYIEHEYMLSSAALEERVGDSTVVGRHVHVVR